MYRWAERIGVPVRVLGDPIWEASRSLGSVDGNCVVTMGDGSWSPTGESLDTANWVTTREWVARGNTLIVVTGDPGALPSEMRKELIPPTFQESGSEYKAFEKIFVDRELETTRVPVIFGGALEVDLKGPRWKMPAAPPAAAGGTGPTGKPSSNAASEPKEAKWQLAADERGGVLFRIPVRRGAVYVLLDELAWTNSGLDHADNARVLAEVLKRELRGGVLAFDEYRHGHGRAESFLVYFLNLPGSRAFLWLGVVWGGLYWYGRNVRLKPVEPYALQERRTAQEYIDAVAALYERARAAPLVVDAVARRLRQLSRSSPDCPASVDEMLETAEQYVKKAERPAFPTTAIDLVNQLIQLRKKVYGTRAAS